MGKTVYQLSVRMGKTEKKEYTLTNPTVGFSPEDARQAEYVTIVGGRSGVSAETEQMLRDSGCKVERIAGRDEDETSRLLAELVRLNRRFQSFEADF